MSAQIEGAPVPLAQEDNVAAGVAWTLASGLFFVAMTGGVRYVGSDMPASVAAFIRYALALLIMAPVFRGIMRRPPSRGTWKLFIARGLLHGIGVNLWFFAMARIPVAEVTALSQATPIFITILAAIILGERLRMRRIVAILVGVVGVLIILRPGVQAIGPGQIAQLTAAPIFAVSFIIAKILTTHARPEEIVAMLSLGCTVTLFPFALAEWQNPTWEEFLVLAAIAAFATMGHYAQTKGYQLAPITVTQPVTFLQIVWATTLGAVAFGEPADAFILGGAALIVGSAWYISWREMRLARGRG